jgi:hypothetical protein
MDNVIQELNKYLPSDLKITGKDLPLTKTKLKKRLSEYAKKYPEKYAQNIHKIGELGEELGYVYGHHIGINDLIHNKKNQIKYYLTKEDAKLKKMSDEQKRKHLLKVFDKVQDMVGTIKDNHLVDQGYSKGRGNPNTITRTIGASVYTIDMHGSPYPFMIKNSLSSGLASHEAFTAGSQARYAAVSAANSTSEPGAMSKILVANTERLKICCKDCGTTNGVEYSVDDSQILGRYEAKTNKLITKDYIKQLKKQHKKTIIVRDPTTCLAPEGVCQMCYGTNQVGRHFDVGHEIGIQASQTIGEKSTQLVLSTKHNIAGSIKSKIPTGFEAQKILLNTPEYFPGKATIATTDGVVDKIEKLNTGGYNIYIADKPHYVSSDVEHTVKVGQSVNKGDIISTGLASPRELVEYAGVNQARKYVVDKLYESNGGDIDKRVFGVVTKGYLDLARHKNDNMHQLYSYDALVSNIELPHTVKMSPKDKQILNKYLAEPFLHYSLGTKITEQIRQKMLQHNIKEIKVAHNPPSIVPVYKTYEQRPLTNTSVWERMNYRGIKKGLSEELLYSGETDFSKSTNNRAKYTLGVL